MPTCSTRPAGVARRGRIVERPSSLRRGRSLGGALDRRALERGSLIGGGGAEELVGGRSVGTAGGEGSFSG
ncbi:MAG: hypothetical protein CMN31_19725 [Sandaracinus sp.]|nr:hypothetical protein [Myxococcales bacterium]MBJ73523.1 hypothetical protein [Sandaracinus sp.]